MAIEFEWDADKADRNLAKHGVSFDEATVAFYDPLSITVRDPDHSVGEQRYLLMGTTATSRLVVVSHTDRGRRVRIISARRAKRRERADYEKL